MSLLCHRLITVELMIKNGARKSYLFVCVSIQVVN